VSTYCRVYVMLSTWTVQHVTFNFPTERKEHFLYKWIRPNIRQHNHVSAKQTHRVANQWLCLNWEANLTSGAAYMSVFKISSLKECSGFNASYITRLTKKKKRLVPHFTVKHYGWFIMNKAFWGLNNWNVKLVLKWQHVY